MSMDKMQRAVWEMSAEMLKRAGKDGGWTMAVHDTTDPDHGYSVGGNPKVPEYVIESMHYKPGPLIIKLISGYIRMIDNADEEFSGGWYRERDGALVLDCPTILESRSQAVALGRERGEDAIYCLHTGETITL